VGVGVLYSSVDSFGNDFVEVMAMATRGYASFQKQIFGYEAEDRLDPDHICFVIDDAVEELKLGEAARGKPGPGAPCYDPRMMLKILVFGYCRGIRSSRKADFAKVALATSAELAAECRENIAFIHLCRGWRRNIAQSVVVGLKTQILFIWRSRA